MNRTHGDRADGSDKTRALKKQVESLKRENARLKKELQKALSRLEDDGGLQDLDSATDTLTKKSKNGEGALCSNCSKGTYSAFTISTRAGEKTYLTCNVCEDRKPDK